MYMDFVKSSDWVIEAISREFRDVLPWKLLYADDLLVIAESEEELGLDFWNFPRQT